MARLLIGTSGGITIPGADHSSPRVCRSRASFNITPASFKPPNSMACSIESPRRKPEAGGSRQGMISCLHGRRLNSSPTGNDCQRTRSTALNCSRTACCCSVKRPGRSCFNCRRIFMPTPTVSHRSSNCSRKKRRYSFEFRHPSWYAPRILKLLSDRISRSACRIIMTRQRRGNAPPISSMCGDTGRAAATRDIILPTCWPIGPAHQVMEEATL
jgi:hypothetical protein